MLIIVNCTVAGPGVGNARPANYKHRSRKDSCALLLIVPCAIAVINLQSTLGWPLQVEEQAGHWKVAEPTAQIPGSTITAPSETRATSARSHGRGFVLSVSRRKAQLIRAMPYNSLHLPIKPLESPDVRHNQAGRDPNYV